MKQKTLTAAAIRPIILATLAHGEGYGYELSRRIQFISNGEVEWNAGTLYPLLHRLETEGLIESFWQPSDAGPRRKYYRLTAKGEAAIRTEKLQWMTMHNVLMKLWQPNVSFA